MIEDREGMDFAPARLKRLEGCARNSFCPSGVSGRKVVRAHDVAAGTTTDSGVCQYKGRPPTRRHLLSTFTVMRDPAMTRTHLTVRRPAIEVVSQEKALPGSRLLSTEGLIDL